MMDERLLVARCCAAQQCCVWRADCIRLPIVSQSYTLQAVANRAEKKRAAAA